MLKRALVCVLLASLFVYEQTFLYDFYFSFGQNYCLLKISSVTIKMYNMYNLFIQGEMYGKEKSSCKKSGSKT